MTTTYTQRTRRDIGFFLKKKKKNKISFQIKKTKQAEALT